MGEVEAVVGEAEAEVEVERPVGVAGTRGAPGDRQPPATAPHGWARSRLRPCRRRGENSVYEFRLTRAPLGRNDLPGLAQGDFRGEV